jgi:hypothetical protein
MSADPVDTRGASSLAKILDDNVPIAESHTPEPEVNEDEVVEKDASEGFCVECEGTEHGLRFQDQHS